MDVLSIWGGQLLASSQAIYSALAQREPAWSLDLPSLLIGFFLGVLPILALYLLRARIKAARDALRARARRVRERLAGGIEEWYREQVAKAAGSAHLLRRHAPLSDLYVPRRLAVPRTLPTALQPPESDRDRATWSLMRFCDLLHPSPVTVTLGQALGQHHKLAVLGPAGSGRTTLLAHLAEVFARHAGAELVLPRAEPDEAAESAAVRGTERERLPLWVSLPALDLSLAERESRQALGEPIVDGVMAALAGLTARPAAALLRSRLMAGGCILLLDDLDLVAPETWPQTIDWIDRLARAYPENIVVVAGSTPGYGALCEIGFAPLILDGFERNETMDMVARWEAGPGWSADGQDQAVGKGLRRKGRSKPVEPETQSKARSELPPPLLEVWPAGRRSGVLPLDLALAIWLWREQGQVPATPLLRYAQVVQLTLDRISDKLLEPAQWMRVLSVLAWRMQAAGEYEGDRELLERSIRELLDQSRDADADPLTLAKVEGDEKADAALQVRSAVDALIALEDLVVDAGRGRVRFVHPLVQAYLAARHAADSGQAERLIAHIDDPRWRDVFSFFSAMSDATPLAVAWLKRKDDLFRSVFLGAANCLLVSPQIDKRLQSRVLSELSQILLDPMQPALIGRSAAAAIAASKDSGALHLFGQAMQHRNPHVRRLGVWGLAQMDHERVLDGLQHAIADRDPWVRIEALYALGSLGGGEVLDGLVRGLQDANDLVRRVAAEALATCRGEGQDLLREGIEHEDVYIRRAAVFGLGKIGEPWVVPLVEQAGRQDREWFVRSAAAEVLERLQAPPPDIVPRSGNAREVSWLAAWAGRKGLALDSKAKVLHALAQALQHEDWTIRLAAVDVLRVYGGEEAISALQSMVQDENAVVREGVYSALYAISLRTQAIVPRERAAAGTP